MKFDKAYTANELAAITGAQVIGNGNLTVTGLNEIHNVTDGDITFVDHEKYYSSTLQSRATAILINKTTELPQGKVLLLHENPFVAYNQLARHFKPERAFKPIQQIDERIGEGAIIHEGVKIGDNVRIGRNCVLHPNVVVYPYSVIGDNVIIHANTTIGSDAFYYKRLADKQYEKMYTAGRVVIESNVEIGANCTIDAGVSSDTTIGNGTKLDNQVHIGHDVKIGEHCILASQVGIAGNTRIGNRVILYGKAGVNKNIEIGDDAVVMATAAVAKSLEGGKSYIGIPAEEARVFARQYAIIKKLPELWEKLRQLI